MEGIDKLPKSFRKFLVKHGDEMLDSFVVYRVPLDRLTTAMLHLITAGQWNKIKERGGQDKLYHVFAIINGKYTYEKTAVPVLKEGTAAAEGNEHSSAPVKRMSIREFVVNAIGAMKDKYYTYSALGGNNCQNFLLDSLKANGMLNHIISNFLYQDIKKLVEETPAFSKWLAQKTTDVANAAQYAIEEVTEKKGGVRHRLEHRRRYRMG